MIVGDFPRHRPNFPAGTVERATGCLFRFTGKASTEHVTRCMLALNGVAWVLVILHPCGGTPVRWRREDPRHHRRCMGGQDSSLWALSAMGREGWRRRSAEWETESAQPSCLQPSSLDCHAALA